MKALFKVSGLFFLFGWGGDKNVMFHAQNAFIYSAFAFCTTYCARMWNKTRCHKHPCRGDPCPKRRYLPRNSVYEKTQGTLQVPLPSFTLHLGLQC